MRQPIGAALSLVTALLVAGAPPPAAAAKPEGTLTVAVATFGNERWLPNLYVGAEDVVLKPMYENLLSRDPKTGEAIPMLADRWQVLDGGRTWKFHIRKGVRFHNGAELTAEDVRFTFATLARDGSANSLAPEFRALMKLDWSASRQRRFEWLLAALRLADRLIPHRAWIFGYQLYLRDMRFRLKNNGDDTYSGTFRTGWLTGVRHFGVNALSHGTLFDDTAPYDSQRWVLPYVLAPERLDGPDL